MCCESTKSSSEIGQLSLVVTVRLLGIETGSDFKGSSTAPFSSRMDGLAPCTWVHYGIKIVKLFLQRQRDGYLYFVASIELSKQKPLHATEGRKRPSKINLYSMVQV